MDTKNDKPFDFWNDHSLDFLEMAMKRDFQERVDTCDGYGKKTRDCGDTLEIFLVKKNDVLDAISYDLKGCLFSHACVNTLIKLARHQTVDQAKQITAEDIIAYLKTLPREEGHCATHALGAFRTALADLEGRCQR